jgi:hypothetical protein
MTQQEIREYNRTIEGKVLDEYNANNLPSYDDCATVLGNEEYRKKNGNYPPGHTHLLDREPTELERYIHEETPAGKAEDYFRERLAKLLNWHRKSFLESAQPSPGYTKEQVGERAEELWDKHSVYLETDIDLLQMYTGQSVLTQRSFTKLIEELTAQLPSAKDAGVLVEAVRIALNQLGGEPSEENASIAHSVLWEALTLYNKPA